jgi:hypothetical protein
LKKPASGAPEAQRWAASNPKSLYQTENPYAYRFCFFSKMLNNERMAAE